MTLSTTGVLVTRASAQAGALLSMFESPGVTFVPFPLLRIEPIDLDQAARQVVQNLKTYDKVIFVSRNAVRYGMNHIQRYWPRLPIALQWFAVGSATAQDLSSHGVAALVPDNPATEGLLEMSELQELDTQQVLIVRGRSGREKLARVLRERGASTKYLEVYQRLSVNWSNDELRRITDRYEQSIVLISSATALESLDELPVDQQQKQSLKLILPSQRLIDLATHLGYTQLTLAADATDESMISGLRRLLGR